MEHMEYLKHVCRVGQVRAAKTAEKMAKEKAYEGYDAFTGLYYDLAKMELAMRGEPMEPIRVFAIDKALKRVDDRLDCADFAIPALVRMLHAHRGTPRLDEEIAQRIEKSLIGFKYWLDEPGTIQACYFTENHQILFHSAEYLVGQLFPDAVFPNDGKTGAQHRAHATEFILRWLTWRERFGFSEWLTQGYYTDDILGLLGLMAYAEEASIRTRCRMLIDMLMFDLAVNGFKGHLPTTHGRVYTRFIIEPAYEAVSSLMKLYFDEGDISRGMNECAVLMASYGYECPKAIVEVAKSVKGVQTNHERMSIDVCDAKYYGVDPADFDNIMFFWGQQTYSDRLTVENSMKVFPIWNWMTNRIKGYREMYRLHDEAGAPCVDAPDYTAMTQVDIHTRRTPDYILSCAQDFRRGRMGYQQHPWTASLGGRAVVFTTNPASLEYLNRPNRWAGNLMLPRAVAHENVLLCLYRVNPDFVDYLNSHIYFPKHEMDEVVEKDGWIFGRKADGYIAVRSLEPGYWEPKDPLMFQTLYPENWEEKYEAAQDYEYISQGHATGWAIEMGSKAENGSFEAFVAGFEQAAFTGDTLNCRYVSPSQGEITFGWNKPLSVQGEEICIHHYKRYDNPFCQAEFDAPKLEITCEGHRTVLDFENVQRIDE